MSEAVHWPKRCALCNDIVLGVQVPDDGLAQNIPCGHTNGWYWEPATRN